MNAISYFSASLARHGWYPTLPNVEIPLNTASACVPPSPGSVLYHKDLYKIVVI